MAKMVGLSRNLKLQWLNKTVELVLEGGKDAEIKEQLNEYLSFEIESPTNIRKTREILMNIWVYENDYTDKIRAMALELIRRYPEYSMPIHCKLIGKMAEYQDEITLVQLKQKLFDEWGERTTLYHSIDKLIATLKALEVLSCEKPGKYHVVTYKISNLEVVSFMVYVMMLVDDRGYYTFVELNSSTYLFPFDYNLSKEALFEDSRFAINNFGGEISISLND